MRTAVQGLEVLDEATCILTRIIQEFATANAEIAEVSIRLPLSSGRIEPFLDDLVF